MEFTREQHDQIIRLRHEIAMSYCLIKGWKPDPRLFKAQQLLELANLEAWKLVPEQVFSQTTQIKWRQ